VATLGSGRKLLVFADSMASIYALDPDSLEIVWQQAARIFETSIITGSISYHDDRLFVPVSSYEVAVSGSPDHVCCKSHGGVIALDANSGKQLWQWHGTSDATLQGRNSAGADLYGPSGVSVWSTPAIDAKRNRIYIGTAENLSEPATDTSDAIIALDMDSGKLAWRFQATAGDVWNAACLNGGANCPEKAGGDFDFGASVIMAELPGGEELLLAGQKSGDVYALNPDPAGGDGEVVWHRQVSNAGVGPDLHQTTTNGGVHWGMALSGERLLVAAADPERVRPDYVPKPGLHALNLADGEILWFQGVTRGCDIPQENKPLIGLQNMRAGKQIELAEQYRCSFYYGLSAAVLATEELVFSAGLDGRIRAFDITSGAVLWQAETAKPFTASNGVSGHGGAIDVSGQVLADGWLYVQSGYSMFGQLPGNVLLAYRLGEAAR
jgi:polyvinyl alcohol dehydrogenase (cytochrome)